MSLTRYAPSRSSARSSCSSCGEESTSVASRARSQHRTAEMDVTERYMAFDDGCDFCPDAKLEAFKAHALVETKPSSYGQNPSNFNAPLEAFFSVLFMH